VDFDAGRKTLTITSTLSLGADFRRPAPRACIRLTTARPSGCGISIFLQHECFLEIRTPQVKLPDGRVVQIEPDWFGKLAGFTLLFEALVLAMAQQMPFAAIARLVNESWHRVHAICSR
jgi:transposase